MRLQPAQASLPDEDHATFSPERDDWKLGLTLDQRETCVGARKRSRVLRLAWRAAISPTQARPEGRRRVTGPLAGAGPVAAAEEAVAGWWWRRWPRAATSAGATSAHRSTSRPTSAVACRPYGARRDHPGAYRRSSSGRGSGADAPPAAHPTYAGTHSAKSNAVAYSRLINPRRGPTGPPRRRRLLHRLRPQQAGAQSISRTSRGGARRPSSSPATRRGASANLSHY
jgi:hypothetical protein